MMKCVVKTVASRAGVRAAPRVGTRRPVRGSRPSASRPLRTRTASHYAAMSTVLRLYPPSRSTRSTATSPGQQVRLTPPDTKHTERERELDDDSLLLC